MKKLNILIFLLIFTSCTKDIDLRFGESDQALVVNCLFSEDSDWKVILSRVKSYSDTAETYVNDANVFIVPENNDTIRLRHKINGTYSADSRPVKGIPYQLVIKDQSKIIRAKSAIPSNANISSVKFTDQHTVFYSNPNLSDFDVTPVDLEIAPTGKQNFIRFRFYSLNTAKIISYVITNNTIDTLRVKQFPEDFLAELSTLIGSYINAYEIDIKVFYNIMLKYNLTYDQYLDTVFPAIEKIETGARDENTYETDLIFSNSSWLSNVSRDTYNVMGELSQTQNASLFVSYYPAMNKKASGSKTYNEEYWLELVSMSEDYYKYQKSYINQVTNISNPFASPIEVYSNIENGVGIFAGYNRQMIHLHDF